MSYYLVFLCILFISQCLTSSSATQILPSISSSVLSNHPSHEGETEHEAQQRHQHIAIFNSTLNHEFLSSLSKRQLGQDFKVLSFDDRTHILLGNFHHPDHSTLLKRQDGWLDLELNHKVTIADHNIQIHGSNINSNNKHSIDNDSVATVQGPYSVQLDVPSWGLSRISQRQLPLANAFGYPHDAGKGVDIYIVDSGVDASNSDFDGRVTVGANFIRGSVDGDENGHGTILAGIAAGTEYGVAKKANIISIKCLSANGTGDIGTIIEGLHYILHDIQSRPQPPRAIINLSLVAQKSAALNQATDALTRAGAIVVAAAGNYHEGDDHSKRNACNYSPASASTVITVGSTDEKDLFASFSKDGKCIDILAPGTSILSDAMQSDNSSSKGIKTWYSGTSYSAPHVAGVLALLSNQVSSSPSKSKSNATETASPAGASSSSSSSSATAVSSSSFTDNQRVIQYLFSLASSDIIANVTKDTPNLLVFNGVETSQMSSTIAASKHHESTGAIAIPLHYAWMLVFTFCWSLFL
ncbi:peptidase S8/S53 domain-containing protein [Absidia repens]|uniref:Peptidase S8/S53 domain-containing protein n=1 Tax=Absidia repens TaxID=90262 RepID=A0A1X2IYI8_9FUNG|nr:peptidase S8/S53 domain-containing protein [Absidia repens]